MRRVLLFLLVFVCAMNNVSALQIIPDLYGFGTDTRAAYGALNDPVIFIVTDLTTDDGTPGDSTRNGVSVKTGSFLEAINYNPPADTGKVILFEVSGIIGDSTQREYYVDHQYTSIMGQTAPSPGIMLNNITLLVRESDILIQHIRVRQTIEAAHPCISVGTSAGGGGFYDVHNVVIDHCSASWAHDDASNILIHNYLAGSGGATNNVTISNCISAEGVHYTGAGGKGMQSSQTTTQVSIINNLFTGNLFRNPYTRGTLLHISNNLAYNNGDTNCAIYGGDDPDGGTDVSYVSNVAKGGPWGPTDTYPQKVIVQLNTLLNYSEIYLLDNRCDDTVNGDTAYVQANASDWERVDDDRLFLNGPFDEYKVLTPPDGSWPDGFSAMASSTVEDYITSYVGARPTDRDYTDERLIGDVINGTGVSSQITSVPYYPALAENTDTLDDLPANPHDDDDSDGYTNLEEWLHALANDVEGDGDSGEGFVYSASNFSYYKTITINQSMVNQSIGDGYFPMLVSITDSDLVDHTQADGDDIVFTNSTGIGNLSHEIESWNSTTGVLVAWVAISDIKNVSTIRMYYNDSDGENLEDAAGVWDSNYMMVHHLQETDIDGGVGDIVDSTSNNNDGTTTNMETADQVAGQVDGSMAFDGTNEYIDITDDNTLDGYTKATWSAWVKPSDVTIDYSGIVSKYDAVVGQRSWALRYYVTNGELEVLISSDGSTYDWSVTDGYSLANDTMTFVTVTYNAGTVKFYKDGDFVSQDANTHTSIYAGSKNAFIGAYRTYYLDGIIDEVKVSNTDRSAAYIQTDYNQTASPSLFISVGEEQGGPDTKFEYWTGSAWDEGPAYYYLWFTCYWHTPECANEEQSGSQATLKITNNGSQAGTPKMKLNESAPAGIEIYVDDDNTFAGAVQLNATYQAVSTELAIDTNVTLWAWANLSGASNWEFETYATVE